MIPSSRLTFLLDGIKWPNLTTELWFKISIVDMIAPESADGTASQFFQFKSHTDFACFEEEELVLVLQEKLQFSFLDFQEIMKTAQNNPLPGRMGFHIDTLFMMSLVEQIDVPFIASVITDLCSSKPN